MGVQQQVFFCDEPYFSLVIMSHYALSRFPPFSRVWSPSVLPEGEEPGLLSRTATGNRGYTSGAQEAFSGTDQILMQKWWTCLLKILNVHISHNHTLI